MILACSCISSGVSGSRQERKDTTQRLGILSFRPEGPLFYANVERMEDLVSGIWESRRAQLAGVLRSRSGSTKWRFPPVLWLGGRNAEHSLHTEST